MKLFTFNILHNGQIKAITSEANSFSEAVKRVATLGRVIGGSISVKK